MADTRTCTTCKQELPSETFSFKNKKAGRRSTVCKKCHGEWRRDWYNRTRPLRREKQRATNRRTRATCAGLVVEYLRTHPCVDCGETNVVLLDFDHRDPSMKTAGISALILNGSMERILAEIEKCDVRCVRCHRLKTAKDFRWKYRIA